MKLICICQIGNTEIKLHPVMLPYLVYAHFCGYLRFALIATVSVCLHETAHALTAALAGKPPSTLALLPIGAVMYLEDEEALSWGKRMLVFLAGPVMTLILCYFALMAAEQRLLPIEFCHDLFLSNCSILLLNLIPALPLDGGRLAAILLSKCLPEQYVTHCMRWMGFAIGSLLVFLNVYISWKCGGWNLSLAIAGCCIIYSSSVLTAKRRLCEMREFMNRKICLEQKGRMKTKLYLVQSDIPLVRLVRRLPANAAAMYLCCEIGTMKIIGWISEYDAVQHYLSNPTHTWQDAIPANNGAKTDKYDTI